MVIPGDIIVEEESEDTDDTESVESYPGESTPDMLSPYFDIESPGPCIQSPDSGV